MSLGLRRDPGEEEAPPVEYKPSWLERLGDWMDEHGEGLLGLLGFLFLWWRSEDDYWGNPWDDW